MSEILTPPNFIKEGRQLLTGAIPGEIAPHIIIAVRDPLGFQEDAAVQISRQFDNARLIADTGMFITYTGNYRGVPVTVCSTGSGAPDTEIALVELAEAAGGKPTFLRIGTSGSAAKAAKVGDLVITTGAVRSEGTTKAYIPEEYPAVASLEVVTALADAAESLGASYLLGITRSTDSIYAGQGREALGYRPPGLQEVAGSWARAGVLNYERETSLILTLCSLFGFRSGSVCAVVNSAVSGDIDPGAGVESAIRVGLESLAILAKRDAIKKRLGKATWVPSHGME
jgi:uridine phosphorylase